MLSSVFAHIRVASCTTHSNHVLRVCSGASRTWEAAGSDAALPGGRQRQCSHRVSLHVGFAEEPPRAGTGRLSVVSGTEAPGLRRVSAGPARDAGAWPGKRSVGTADGGAP
ncbi:hypothetical protein CB1_000377008 [Camelus ferus]|nr:hypothetical protein CB1_000377008 [Camelus ferus]